jgi:hypothetical protein
MLSIIFPIAIFTTLLSERIVLFVYGTGYSASVEVLQIVIWALVFAGLTSDNTTTLNAMNKQRVVRLPFFSLWRLMLASTCYTEIQLYRCEHRGGLDGSFFVCFSVCVSQTFRIYYSSVCCFGCR